MRTQTIIVKVVYLRSFDPRVPKTAKRPNGLDESWSKFTSEVSGSIVNSDQSIRKEKKRHNWNPEWWPRWHTSLSTGSNTLKQARLQKTNPPLCFDINFHLGGKVARLRVHAAKNRAELYSSTRAKCLRTDAGGGGGGGTRSTHRA